MSTQNIYTQYQNYVNQPAWQTHAVTDKHLCAEQQQSGLQHQIQVNHFDSDIILSRIRGRGEGLYDSQVEDFNHNFSLFVMLAGQNQFTLPNHQQVTASPNQIWLVKGHWHKVTERITTTNGQLGTIHLDFSHQRLCRWQDEGLLTHKLFSAKTQADSVVSKISDTILPIKHLLHQLLHMPYGRDSISQLELESATLSLTALLLKFCLNDKPQPKHQRQIREVVDIIHAEFAKPLTITGLARRVGINECHLKQYFKAQTGETIGAQIRRLRLDLAMEMLTLQNKSITETMWFVGYKHAGHFNRVFSQRFGVSPKQAKSLMSSKSRI